MSHCAACSGARLQAQTVLRVDPESEYFECEASAVSDLGFLGSKPSQARLFYPLGLSLPSLAKPGSLIHPFLETNNSN